MDISLITDIQCQPPNSPSWGA